jgi:hypothetical protein
MTRALIREPRWTIEIRRSAVGDSAKTRAARAPPHSRDLWSGTQGYRSDWRFGPFLWQTRSSIATGLTMGSIDEFLRSRHGSRCDHTLRALPTCMGAANLDGAGAACVTEYPLTSWATIEPMFDRSRAVSRIDASQCACDACNGRLTDASLSPGNWRFCRICRCAWKVSVIDHQTYATAIHSPLHTKRT